MPLTIDDIESVHCSHTVLLESLPYNLWRAMMEALADELVAAQAQNHCHQLFVAIVVG